VLVKVNFIPDDALKPQYDQKKLQSLQRIKKKGTLFHDAESYFRFITRDYEAISALDQIAQIMGSVKTDDWNSFTRDLFSAQARLEQIKRSSNVVFCPALVYMTMLMLKLAVSKRCKSGHGIARALRYVDLRKLRRASHAKPADAKGGMDVQLANALYCSHRRTGNSSSRSEKDAAGMMRRLKTTMEDIMDAQILGFLEEEGCLNGSPPQSVVRMPPQL